MDVFKNNGYPRNLTIIASKRFWMANIEFKKKMIMIPKKTLLFPLLYLGPLSSSQTRKKLRKSLRGNLNCCKF